MGDGEVGNEFDIMFSRQDGVTLMIATQHLIRHKVLKERTHTHLAMMAIISEQWRVDCVSLCIVAHCVSGLFSGFVGYEKC